MYLIEITFFAIADATSLSKAGSFPHRFSSTRCSSALLMPPRSNRLPSVQPAVAEGPNLTQIANRALRAARRASRWEAHMLSDAFLASASDASLLPTVPSLGPTPSETLAAEGDNQHRGASGEDSEAGQRCDNQSECSTLSSLSLSVASEAGLVASGERCGSFALLLHLIRVIPLPASVLVSHL